MLTKRISKIVSILVLLIIITVGVWYALKPDKQSMEEEIKPPASLFKFQILDESLSQTRIQILTDRFNRAVAVIENSPDKFNFQAVNEIAMVKKSAGDYQGAEEAWIYLGEMRPKNSLSFANLGDLYAGFLKKPEKAEKAFLQAIANEPTDPNFYRQLADVYRYSLPNMNRKVPEIILKGLDANPNDENLMSYLGAYYQELNENNKAIDWYEKVLKVNPQNKAVRRELNKLKQTQ